MGFPITAPHNALDDALSRPLQGYIVCCTSIPPEQRVRAADANIMEANPTDLFPPCRRILRHLQNRWEQSISST